MIFFYHLIGCYLFENTIPEKIREPHRLYRFEYYFIMNFGCNVICCPNRVKIHERGESCVCIKRSLYILWAEIYKIIQIITNVIYIKKKNYNFPNS